MNTQELQRKHDLLLIERDAQSALISDQQAEVERQTEISNNFAAQVRQQDETITSLRAEVDHRQSLLRESNRNCAEHAGVVWERNVTIQQQTLRIAALEKEVSRLKTVPMKYRRMEFNAQLQYIVQKQSELIAGCSDDLLSAKQMLERHGEVPYFLQDRLAAIAKHKKSPKESAL